MHKSIFTKDYSLFLAELRAARRRARLTQGDVARRIGETQSFVSKCERGERRIDILELRQFCRAFETPLSEFVRRLEKALA